MLKLLLLFLLLLGVCGKPSDIGQEINSRQETSQFESLVPLSKDLMGVLTRNLRSIEHPSLQHSLSRRRKSISQYAALPRSRHNYDLISRIGFPTYHREERALAPHSKLKERRGLNVGIDIGTLSPGTNQSNDEINRLLDEDLKPLLLEALNHTSSSLIEEAVKEIESGLVAHEPSTTSSFIDEAVKEIASGLVAHESSTTISDTSGTSCNECKEVANVILQEEEEKEMKEMKSYHVLLVRPMYPCDEWNPKTRTCFLDRNLGDSVTFVLSIENLGGDRPHIVWRQEFHMRNSNIRKDAVLDSVNPPWNVVIGTQGYEFRLSPITEIDIDFNRFSATVLASEQTHSSEIPTLTTLNKLTFQIRTVAVDLGFVYPGEALTLNVHSFVTLPVESMHFKWFLERDGESSTLPSNMRTSPSGGSVAISELRKEQEGVLTCSVYTNKDIFATKKRFLIKELMTDVLMGMEPQKPHELPEYHEIPVHGTSHSKILSRHVRQVQNEDEIDFVNMDKSIDDRNRIPGYSAGSGHSSSENMNSNFAEKGGVVEIANENGYPEIIPIASDQQPMYNANPNDVGQRVYDSENYPEQNAHVGNAMDEMRQPPDDVKRVQISEGLEPDGSHDKNSVVMDIEKNLRTNEFAVPQNAGSSSELASNENYGPIQDNMQYMTNQQSLVNNHGGMHPVMPVQNVDSEAYYPKNEASNQMVEPYNGVAEQNRLPVASPEQEYLPPSNDEQNPVNYEAQKYVEAALSHPNGANSHEGQWYNPNEAASNQEETVHQARQGSNHYVPVETSKHHHEISNHPAKNSHGKILPEVPVENGFVVDIQTTAQNREVKAEDKISRLLSECRRDSECSGHATCEHSSVKTAGFCRCHTGYHGNGIFCWEDTNLRSVVGVEEERFEAKVTEHVKPVAHRHSSLRRRATFRHGRMRKP